MFHKHPGGKGDKPILPKDQEKFDNNWDAIFKKPGAGNKEPAPSGAGTGPVPSYPSEVIR